MAYDPNNIFARILRKEIPARTVYEDDFVLAFHDIAPKAPIHVLVIPKSPYISIADFSATASSEELTGFWRAVSKIAEEQGLTHEGFRLISNSGPNSGQEVPHFHVHLFGGTFLGV
ncbi:histidine triad nucleotide-binding protein [Gluconobacter kondonii]|uniref:Histidine triad nucleotide-binding protein n=1 Tax=Gluconobacter kondonii TaxID=941463 RepID=A0ABQ5WUN5_9PROT|nr:histidine triad nucleotide-binding protein [Gluconobacter kondonii]MBN3867817.1 histidine triad nucleotide-binding protein [Gluconobacter kondonii]MBS1054459.1 histidine triad nucleotide-binding protein [Gluconobacter kondonii]MBS1057069.1 histidine triad nucleotide-binding protein [Gluconobacter kondonii]MBS1065520.1 histidine triad nucleotide-binding protein [Gluconobacter kondonii]MBS1078729.1 histidine triad nucleotide-binding protein [Gluconobacter kondonii]